MVKMDIAQGRAGLPPAGLPPAAAPSLAVPRTLLERWPHLPAFWPGRPVVPMERAGPGAVLVLPEEEGVPRGWAGEVLRPSLRPFAPARFGDREAPPLVVLPPGGEAAPVPDIAELAALIARRRIGGPAGMADPGGAAFDLPERGLAVVLDPC